MKKLIGLLLMVMVLVVSGCGNNNNGSNGEVEPVRAEGIYQGVDSSGMVAIEVDGTLHQYAYASDVEWTFHEMLNTGDEVVFTYMENEDGDEIIDFIQLKAMETMVEGAKGVFVGLADSHTVEIVVDGEPMPFGLAEQIVLQDFKEGDSVVFNYYQDRGRLIIMRMEKQ